MPALNGFVEEQIRMLEGRLRGYLSGAVTAAEMAEAARSVTHAWSALPAKERGGGAEAHEDVLWHAVGLAAVLPEDGGAGVGDPRLHEALHLLESRAPVPQHYAVRRPGG